MSKWMTVVCVAALAWMPCTSVRAQQAEAEEPSIGELQVVGITASAISLVSLGVGIAMGVLAQQQYACAQDIITCNTTLQNKVVGSELFDLRAEVDQKAMFADMAYLVSAAGAVVGTVGILRGFVFTDPPATPTSAAVVPGEPAPVEQPATAPAPAPATPAPAAGGAQ
jgi:hypothetical protein